MPVSPRRSLAFLLLALAALAPARLHAAEPSAMPVHPVAPADKAMMSGMGTMQRAMGTAPLDGDPDHDFVSMMIPHHAGAVDMAEVELRFGRDPAMRALATRIVADQKREMGEMRDWLRTHPAPGRG